MSKCTSCGDTRAYIGMFSVECPNANCKFYYPVAPVPIKNDPDPDKTPVLPFLFELDVKLDDSSD